MTNKTTKVSLNIPSVNGNNVNRMWQLFRTPVNNKYGAILKYIETLYDEKSCMWKVEYKITANMYSIGFLKEFKKYISSTVGDFPCLDVKYNGYDRVYYFIRGNDSNGKLCFKAKVKTPSDRDIKRSQAFKEQVAALEIQAVNKGAAKIFGPVSEQNKGYKNYLKGTTVKENVPRPGIGFVQFQAGKTLEPNVVENLNTTRNFEREKELVEQSVQMKGTYVKGLFSDFKIIQNVRIYLAYLKHYEYDEVSSKGDTRLTSELFLKSKGLPLGEDLAKLYYSCLAEKGFKANSLDRDLEVLRNYERGQKMIRLQTAREKTTNWYSSPSGKKIDVIELPKYFNVEVTSMQRGLGIVKISDRCGPIARFA